MVEKKPKQIVKDERGFIINLREFDYRGALAIMLAAAYIFALLTGNSDASSALGPLAGSAVAWWFARRED